MKKNHSWLKPHYIKYIKLSNNTHCISQRVFSQVFSEKSSECFPTVFIGLVCSAFNSFLMQTLQPTLPCFLKEALLAWSFHLLHRLRFVRRPVLTHHRKTSSEIDTRYRRTTRGREKPPCLLLKSRKVPCFWKKKALIVSIFGWNFPLTL